MDKYTISSMLTAIKDFVGESFKTYEYPEDPTGLEEHLPNDDDEMVGLEELKHGEVRILIEYGEKTYLAMVTKGDAPENIRERMGELLERIEEEYEEELLDWDGDEESLGSIQEWIEPLLDEK